MGVILGEFGLSDSLEAFILRFETGVLSLDFLQQKVLFSLLLEVGFEGLDFFRE